MKKIIMTGGGSAGQAGTNHDDVEVAFVGGVHQALMGFIVGPFLSNGAFGNFGIDLILRLIA